MMLSTEAVIKRNEFGEWIETQLGEGGSLSGITDWASKLPGAAVRLAGLSHLADLAEAEPNPWNVPIPGSTIERAIILARYLIPHAIAAFGMMGADPVLGSARRVMSWIRSNQIQSFSRSQAFNALRGQFERAAQINAPIDVLTERGFVRPLPETPCKRPGRKPSPTYEVNPAVFPDVVTHITHNTQNCEIDPDSANRLGPLFSSLRDERGLSNTVSGTTKA